MERISLPFVLTLLLISTINVFICDATNTTEIEANTVQVTFYRLSVSKWNSGNMESTFNTLVATEANNYCSANPATCGLDFFDTNNAFKETNVIKIQGTPQAVDDTDLGYAFYVEYPAGSNVSSSSALQFVLSTAVVKTIVKNIRDGGTYLSQLGCNKCYITYIGDDFYGIPPSSLENKIIIPLAFLVLLIIIIVALVLHFWNKKREKNRKWDQKHLVKQKFHDEDYGVHVESDLPTKPIPAPDQKLTDRKSSDLEKNQRWGYIKDKMYGDSTTVPKAADKLNRTGGASNDSGLDSGVDPSRYPTKNTALEPIDQTETDGKRKKKKKERKHKSKRSTKVDGVENQGYFAEDEAGQDRMEMKTEL